MGAILDSNVIYLSIANGKISRRVKEPTKTSVERTTNDGKNVHEEIFKGWTGKITGIKIKEHPQYGRSWLVTLSDNECDAILQMNYSSGYSSAFLKALPNVDFNKEVELIPSMKIEDDKKKVTLFVKQNGQALKHYWNRENPGDLPQMEKIKVKNKKTGKIEDEWSDFEMMVFLEKYVNDNILPKIKAANNNDNKPEHQEQREQVADLPVNNSDTFVEEPDDLPF